MTRIKKLLTVYGFKRVSEISAFAHSIVGSIQASTYIKDGKAMAEPLNTAVQVMDTFVAAHPQLTKLLTSQLNVLRKVVLTELSKIATQLNLDFAGNEAALLSSGLELAADPVAQQSPVAPGLCEIVMGTQSGSMVLRIKRALGSINALWCFTTDPALLPEQWSYRLSNEDTLLVPGLKPGERLYARAACLNGASTMDNLAFTEAKPRYVE